MRWFLLLAILLIPFTAYSEASLGALIACDTFSDLRSSTKKDFSHLKSSLQEVSRYTGLHLKMNVLFGSSLSTQSVQSWITALEKEPPEVVVFYFSGHGCRSERINTPWPCLLFSKKLEHFQSEGLYSQLKALPSRLVIILLDCCNTSEQSIASGFMAFAPKSASSKGSLPGLKSLFMNTHGIIIAAGASPGELSFALRNGSLFTNCLLQAVRDECGSFKASWQNIFHHTCALCSPTQRPISMLDISTSHHGLKGKNYKPGLQRKSQRQPGRKGEET